MIFKEIKVKIKDDGVPYIFENKHFECVDNMLIVTESDTTTWCFPMENVLYYKFEKYK